jgi:uncharacterized membrane protein
MSPERLAVRAYIVLAAVFGSFFVLVTPPLQVPDEEAHLVRAWAVSHGQPLAERGAFRGFAGVQVPRSLAELDARLGRPRVSFDPSSKVDLARLRDAFQTKLRPEDQVPYVFPTAYSPLCYLAPGAALRIGEALDLSPVALVYLGRGANLLVSVLLVALAIGSAPTHRFTLMMLGLLPTVLAQAAGLTADSPTNALAFLFCGLLLRECAEESRLGGRRAVMLGVLAVLVGSAKQVYWPLCLALAAIPGRRFGSPLRRMAFVAAVTASTLLVVGLWWAALLRVAPLFTNPGVDPFGQVRYIVLNPLAFLRVLWATTLGLGGEYQTFVGVLGHLDTVLPQPVYLLAWTALLGVAVLDGGARSPVRGATRAILAGSAGLVHLSILETLYLTVMPVGAPVVLGVLGRYFIPPAPFLFVALHRGKGVGLPRQAAWAALAAAAIVLAAAATTLAARYYAP